jgi:hypothetical protein
MYNNIDLENKKVLSEIVNEKSVYLLGTPMEVLQFDPNTLPPFGAL